MTQTHVPVWAYGFDSRPGYFAVMPQLVMGRSPQPVIRESGLGVRGLASRLGRCSSLREGRPLDDRNLSQRYGDMAELAKALPR